MKYVPSHNGFVGIVVDQGHYLVATNRIVEPLLSDKAKAVSLSISEFFDLLKA